jgi:hypothetical protein
MPKEQEHVFEVVLKWTCVYPATSKRIAMEAIKQNFLEEYSIELKNKEMEYKGVQDTRLAQMEKNT